MKTYVVGTRLNRLSEAIIINTNNIGFYGELTKIILQLSVPLHCDKVPFSNGADIFSDQL